MRKEILFRGITIEEGKMVEGYPQFDVLENCFRISESTTGQYLFHYIKNETLGEFTGKYDGQVKKIFEDDIIENVDTKELQIVYWNEDKASWYCRSLNDLNINVPLYESLGNLNIKVGNIWSNPKIIIINK